MTFEPPKEHCLPLIVAPQTSRRTYLEGKPILRQLGAREARRDIWRCHKRLSVLKVALSAEIKSTDDDMARENYFRIGIMVSVREAIM